jgi:hypothetical protein
MYKVFKNTGGYLMIYKPKHHFTTKSGYILLHRFVYEYFNKCCLLPYIDIHHINRIKTDNHKYNLIAVTSSEHMKIHKPQLNMSNRICFKCCKNSNEIPKRKDNNKPDWRLYNNNFVCRDCYGKLRYKIKPKKPKIDYICLLCDSKTTTIIRNKYPYWVKYKNGYICKKCYMVVYNKKRYVLKLREHSVHT